MEHLDITIAKLSSASGNIRQTNQRLNQCLQEINTVMNQLSLYWNSPASLALKTRFQNMLPVFENYEKIVDSYAFFLDQTVEVYHTLEQSLQQHADSF